MSMSLAWLSLGRIPSRGSVWLAISTPSAEPSPSVSGLKGSVPICNSFKSPTASPSVSASRGSVPESVIPLTIPVPVSNPSDRPSPSVSSSRGFVDAGCPDTTRLTSSPSVSPSKSLSGLQGSVPKFNSAMLDRPSLSGSLSASATFLSRQSY